MENKETNESTLQTLLEHLQGKEKIEGKTDDEVLVEYMEMKYPEMTGEFTRILRETYKTFLEKQFDYGTSNIAMGTHLETDDDIRMSLTGLIVRMNDKIQRLLNLVLKTQSTPKNESIEDTFKDLGVYAIISRVVLAKMWGK